MIALALSSLFLFSTPSQAAAPTKGYVVRTQGTQVWLDLTAADGAAPGRGFQVYTEGESIKHPVTGEELGKAESKVAEGKIEEVSEKYSVGRVPEPNPMIATGQRARLLAVVAPSVAVAPVVAAPVVRTANGDARAPRTRGASLPFVVTAMAVADFDGAGKPQIVLSDETNFRLYAYPAAEHKPLATGAVDGTGARILSLEWAALDGDKKASLFVSVYHEQFRRFETRVYKLDAGKWVKTVELPYLVRAHQNPKGERVVATQQIIDDKTFPYGAIYPLAWKDGKYAQGRPALNPRRVDWLYGFSFAQLDAAGDAATLYLTSVNTLRVQFANGSWRSAESFGQSPLRVRWYEKLFEVNPPMLSTYNDKGYGNLYIVRNLAMLGGLANPFGLFNGGELHAKAWTGVAFETAWKADLGGFSPGFALVEAEPGRKELVVAVAGSTGKSAVWTFDP